MLDSWPRRAFFHTSSHSTPASVWMGAGFMPSLARK